ncbi:MAG: phosphodiester glycosidase family protein [Planctomycetaceae bacterium]
MNQTRPRPRSHRAAAVRAALGAVVLAAVLAPSAAAVTGERMMVTGSGYTLYARKWDHQQVRIVTFYGEDGFVVRPALAYSALSGRKVTSKVGAEHGALMATNGGFRAGGTDAPRHLTVIDGELITTGSPSQMGWTLSTTADGTQAWVGRRSISITATQGAVSFAVVGWNAQQPSKGTVTAFTTRGGTSRYPSTHTCSAFLQREPGTLESRTYLVTAVRSDCTKPSIQPSGGHGNVVLAGKPVGQLVVGQPVTITVDLGHPGVANVMGGLPRLVKHGVNVGPACLETCGPKRGPDRAFYGRNPRTAVGIGRGCVDGRGTTPCEYFLVTVDGRLPGWSDGLRFPGLGHLLVDLGAWGAVNLDGGGSTTMWTRARSAACQSKTEVGCLVNRTSYGQRRVVDATVMVPVPTASPSP